MSNHSAQWIFSISITKSNLDIFQLFWKHWIQLNQNYNYVFQSMWDNQRAYVDSSEERITTRWAITQRSESSQSQLLNQISMFFNYFESIEFNWIRATIMLFKVCEIVSASKSIRAKKDDERWAIKQTKSSIFSHSFAKSNLRLFSWFLNRWSRLSRLDNCCQRKYCAWARLVDVQAEYKSSERMNTNQRVKWIIIERRLNVYSEWVRLRIKDVCKSLMCKT